MPAREDQQKKKRDHRFAGGVPCALASPQPAIPKERLLPALPQTRRRQRT